MPLYAFQDTKPLCALPEDLSDSLQAQMEESAARLSEAIKGKDVPANLLKAWAVYPVLGFLPCRMFGCVSTCSYQNRLVKLSG